MAGVHVVADFVRAAVEDPDVLSKVQVSAGKAAADSIIAALSGQVASLEK